MLPTLSKDKRVKANNLNHESQPMLTMWYKLLSSCIRRNTTTTTFARPTNNNGGANIDLGGLLNPQTWANFGNQASVQFQPQQGGGGDVSFPGKVPTTMNKMTTSKTTTIKTTMNKKSSTTLTSLTNLDDVPGWWWFFGTLVAVFPF